MKVPVSKRTLIRRINRVLVKEGKLLRVARPPAANVLGDLFITEHGSVTQRRVELEKLARRLGVLHDYEKLERTT